MTDNQNWLAEYTQTGSDAAFRELVTRYVDLVYSTALRSVGGDAHRAEDVAQMVFVNLARVARTLPPDVKLGGWLHRDTCFTAATLMRGERRRQARERQAAEMNALQSHPETDYSLLAPVLDEAINELDETDRSAILLRFFEQNNFRSVGEALGSNEDAARMRVNRALEKLEDHLKRRGVTIAAASLGVVLSANAVQAAPVGLAVTISTAATLIGTTLATTATITATKAIAMTALQKTIVTATVAVLAGAGIYEARQAAQLRNQVQTLQQQQAPLTEQIQQLQNERNETTRQFASLRDENETLNRNTGELLRLRGEVSLLRRDQGTTGKSANSSASPADTTTNQEQTAADIGRKLGEAVVRGDSTASDKLMELAKSEYASFNTNRVDLSDTQRGELATRTFAPLCAAFEVITREAVTANPFALNALSEMSQVRELTGIVIQSLGTLAGSGNDSALEILLNPLQNGFPPSSISSTVGALVPAAKNGNQKAIDSLAAVARDANQRALWFIAADGLNEAAEAGNKVAIDALIGFLGSTNHNVRNAAISGLKGAAANQNASAGQALRSAGLQ